MALAFGGMAQLRALLAEDIGDGDVTGALLSKRRVTGTIISRERAVLSGSRHACRIFRIRGCHARQLCRDGGTIRAGQRIIKVSGMSADILACERTALNLMSRMSGIATATASLVSRAPKGVGVYSTRKTAPGLRHFDKEAVVDGGGKRHRMGLYDGIMVKDNHIAAEGSLDVLLERARKKSRRFEVEADDIAGAMAAARGGATTIMLDNFTPRQAAAAVRALEKEGLRDTVRLEVSGGITSRNIARYGRTGVDMISSGSITGSPKGVDFSLEVPG